jgi:ABC-type phosphate/phosphonate transport system substrate-binding protein
VIVLTIPVHPTAFAAFMVWQITFNVLGHCGYELFPPWFLRTPAGWVLNSVTHHALHHEKFRANFGLYFNVWDRLMGTNHRDYEHRFAQAAAGLAEDGGPGGGCLQPGALQARAAAGCPGAHHRRRLGAEFPSRGAHGTENEGRTMTRQKRVGLGITALAAGLVGPALSHVAVGQPADPPATVRIGLVRTLFRDVPEPMVQLMMMEPFGALMRSHTGLNGKVIACGDAHDLGGKLHRGKVDLGVFHGFEFAWAQEKYPDLRPLAIAINKYRHLTANLVVRNDTDAAGFTSLKGKVIALPRHSPEHCRLFLERACRECGAEPRGFFTKVATPANVEDALDEVVRGKVQAAVVDGVSLKSYQQIKSGCCARLKVLKQSEIFPAAVVAYRQGALEPATLTRIHEGMIGANQNARGRDLMAMWKLTAFENVPADYAQTLANIARVYP